MLQGNESVLQVLQANESVPGQSNEAICSQLEQEQEQPTLPNENNVPAKNNPDTTSPENETKRKNSPAKNSSDHDKNSSRHRTIMCGDSLVKTLKAGD